MKTNIPEAGLQAARQQKEMELVKKVLEPLQKMFNNCLFFHFRVKRNPGVWVVELQVEEEDVCPAQTKNLGKVRRRLRSSETGLSISFNLWRKQLI